MEVQPLRRWNWRPILGLLRFFQCFTGVVAQQLPSQLDSSEPFYYLSSVCGIFCVNPAISSHLLMVRTAWRKWVSLGCIFLGSFLPFPHIRAQEISETVLVPLDPTLECSVGFAGLNCWGFICIWAYERWGQRLEMQDFSGRNGTWWRWTDLN